jgi:hypothetical protein
MVDIFTRVGQSLLGRVDGPLHFRLFLQPTVASVLAIRAGIRDAREGRPAFLWAIVSNAGHRRGLLTQAWKDIRNLAIVAVSLDVIYQLIVLRWIYLLELLITATTLAVVPYMLLRGLANRIARRASGQRWGQAFSAGMLRKRPSKP